jgi:imidazoleglycerol-phosphate dehydratase
MTDATVPELRCSFCGKRQDQIRELISSEQAGIEAHICNQCVARFTETIPEEREGARGDATEPVAGRGLGPARSHRPQRARSEQNRRFAEVERATRETSVRVSLDLDGEGQSEAATGIPFFDHMLEQLGKHAGFDLVVKAEGDLEVDTHHTVEDVGLCIGQALATALGDRAGVRRFGSVTVPLDETLVEVALDLSGRPHVEHDVAVPAEAIGSYDPRLTEDFVRAFASSAAMTVHVRLITGRSPHHIVEAEFKALARALGDATRVAGPIDQGPPSTKSVL